ncbi:MAG: hypothetical protein CL678_13280 [Bdellovibrionaceae bacterium]|nr:hypothetical protein [Pseudobdellovibrionaceae bacterium]|tara:strand:+ start:2199 stop:2573 length:375 start_codon:yes stop_codon:yes gene_type:complete
MIDVGEFGEGLYWFFKKESSVVLGLTHKALQELGEVISVDYVCGEGLAVPDEVIFRVEGVSGEIEFSTPFDCDVFEVNQELRVDPEVLSEDPLESGWLVKFNVKSEEAFEAFIEEQAQEQQKIG